MPPLPAHAEFAIATRDELWVSGACVESRISCGVARDEGSHIVARQSADMELIAAADDALAPLRAGIPPDARVRIVATARRSAGQLFADAAMTLTINGVSVVSRDATFLRERLAMPITSGALDLPLAWWNGSAAVLLHEAVGHAAEAGASPVEWPSWLSVRDEPPVPVDDAGQPAHAVDLLREPPSSLRRETFRDVPLLRMTRLVARQQNAPFELPEERIDVHLIAGGSFDPLTDTVAIDVAVSSRGAFTLRRKRSAIAASLAGAIGDPLEYPGVICSREGQALFVGSYAPVMVTR